jgi:DNA-binding GntR family transcriptional regulator
VKAVEAGDPDAAERAIESDIGDAGSIILDRLTTRSKSNAGEL